MDGSLLKWIRESVALYKTDAFHQSAVIEWDGESAIVPIPEFDGKCVVIAPEGSKFELPPNWTFVPVPNAPTAEEMAIKKRMVALDVIHKLFQAPRTRVVAWGTDAEFLAVNMQAFLSLRPEVPEGVQFMDSRGEEAVLQSAKDCVAECIRTRTALHDLYTKILPPHLEGADLETPCPVQPELVLFWRTKDASTHGPAQKMVEAIQKSFVADWPILRAVARV